MREVTRAKAQRISGSKLSYFVNIKRMVAPDDSSLVRQSQQGDQQAFESLIREHRRMIHSLCYRMTGSMGHAEDLTQETFIQAYQHLTSFREQARFSSWLYRIAANLCVNWQKSRARHQRLEEE